MPTTYAHDRFGREVYEQLPANLKKIIRENKKLYLIGLHGPDIFFYYHPFSKNRVSDYGTFLHEQTASVLFEDEDTVVVPYTDETDSEDKTDGRTEQE